MRYDLGGYAGEGQTRWQAARDTVKALVFLLILIVVGGITFLWVESAKWLKRKK